MHLKSLLFYVIFVNKEFVVCLGVIPEKDVPGMVAVFTTLPAIAVPLRSPLLDGLDSILSMLHMHSGVPVATVSVDGARNAAMFACQIASCTTRTL